MNGNFSPEQESSDMESRLWDYIDGSSREASTIKKLIAENIAWRTKYAELLDIHSLVQGTELEEPSLRFTKDVMEEIARLQITPAAKKYINTKIIWGIAAFFITIIVGFLGYGFSQVNWSSSSSSNTAMGIDFASVDYSRMFGNSFVNLFMMLNVVLGLMLLDRYLSMKRKKLMNR
ncbi:MAG: hypothetical protein M3Q06_07210 [Bacteroidota bacterium]|nr:hypothetical protein [Bacteroidota bacterium]